MSDVPKNIEFAHQALKEIVAELPSPMTYGMKWEEINFFGSDIEKPSKEAFEAKLKELIDAQPLKELRTKRNKVISSTDYLFTSDFPHATPEKKQEWLDYRQALRDLPSVTEDPLNPVWPTIPTA